MTLLAGVPAMAESPDGVLLASTARGDYYQVERSNWSTWKNGAYKGLTHRETRARIGPNPSPGGSVLYDGTFYVLEETTRDAVKEARAVDEAKRAAFTVDKSGHMSFQTDEGYPRLRDLPTFPDQPVRPGDRWQAEAIRVIDPMGDGRLTDLPILVEYTYVGDETYRGIPARRIRAKYATRFPRSPTAWSRGARRDAALASATGTHDLDIIVDGETGSALLILDRLDESFSYSDGSSVRFKGSTAIFAETPVPVKREEILPLLRGIVARSPDAGDGAAKADSGKSRGSSSSPGKAAPRGETADDTFGDAGATAPASDTPPARPVAKATPKPEASAPAPFAVEETEAGIRLSVRDIRFVPDSDQIIPAEAWRLDAIAEALRGAIKSSEGASFLVEGHTASVGKPSGELELSLRRARRVVDELVARGVGAERFMYRGLGGTVPLADNATAAGRAQNRRVEITILD